MPSFLRFGIFHKFQCGGCNAAYCGKTKRQFKIKICEHLRILALTRKKDKGDDDSAVKEHLFSATTHLILKISQFSLPTTTTSKLP